MSAFWVNYRREQEAKLAVRVDTRPRCAICNEPILPAARGCRAGKRCPTCLDARVTGAERAERQRVWRVRQRRA